MPNPILRSLYISADMEEDLARGESVLKKVKAQQVKMSTGHKVKMTQGQQVTRSTGQRGLLKNRVYSRTHFSTSLSPEEGPSCFYIYLRICRRIPASMKKSVLR